MVQKCTNQTCSARFRSLQEGRLFRLETDTAFGSSPVLRPEYFWLRSHCSELMTLQLGSDGQVVVVPLSHDDNRPNPSQSSDVRTG